MFELRPMSSFRPLALDNPRWATLPAHFDNTATDGDVPAVPTLIAQWQAALGTYAEEYAYAPLRESYLHQQTIVAIAYAVVPHLVTHLAALDEERRALLLDDIAIVEQVRLTPQAQLDAMIRELEQSAPGDLRAALIKNTQDRHPLLPADLAEAYLAAVHSAKLLAGAHWGELSAALPSDYQTRRHTQHLLACGWHEADIHVAMQALVRETDEGPLMLGGSQAALEGLRQLSNVPTGFWERTKLRDADETSRLAQCALLALAWLQPPELP